MRTVIAFPYVLVLFYLNKQIKKKNNLSEKVSLVSNPRFQSIAEGEGRKSKPLGTSIQTQQQRKINARVPACLLLSHAVQGPVPREWYHPQRSGYFYFNYQDNPSSPPTGMPTGQPHP